MTHQVAITRAGDSQPIRPDGVVLLDPTTGSPVAPAAQGLTDTQLRAAAVPVSLAATPGLTDTQLRAAAVPVALASTPGLTDTQLRAARVNTDTLGTPGATGAKRLTANATTANAALTPTTRRISMRARNADCRFVIGVGAQTASATDSHYIAQDERLDFAVPANAQIATIRDSAATVNGVIELTELT